MDGSQLLTGRSCGMHLSCLCTAAGEWWQQCLAFFNWSGMQWRLHYWIRRQLWMRLIKLYLNCCQIWESSIYSHRILSRWKIWNANIWHDTRKAARVHPDVPAIYLAVCLKPNFMTTWKYFYENKCQPQTKGTNEIAVKSKTPTATNAIVWKHGLHIQ